MSHECCVHGYTKISTAHEITCYLGYHTMCSQWVPLLMTDTNSTATGATSVHPTGWYNENYLYALILLDTSVIRADCVS
jgi:hypothetical protein